jgi:hypothetical protein
MHAPILVLLHFVEHRRRQRHHTGEVRRAIRKPNWSATAPTDVQGVQRGGAEGIQARRATSNPMLAFRMPSPLRYHYAQLRASQL